jgi:hypothetical protein
MASEMGVSEAAVLRVWHDNGLKDKRYAEKVESIVGLYLNPPEHAIVLCVDEKVTFSRWIELSLASH